jgi:hypothetical protein
MSVTTTMKIIEKDHGMAEMRKRIALLSDSYVKVGFPQGAPVGTAKETGSGHRPYSTMSEVAQIAVWNEFGVPLKNGMGWLIPPRPFFQYAMAHRDEIQEFMERVYMDFLLGKYSSADKALEAVGLKVQDIIKVTIVEGDWHPNAPRTIEEKKSSHPLIDTAQMLNSVTFVKHISGLANAIKEGSVLL